MYQQSAPILPTFSYKNRKIVKTYIHFFCRNLHETQGTILSNLGLDKFLPRQRDNQRVVRNNLGDIIHALGYSVLLPEVGRRNLTQSKETVFYSNCHRLVVQVEELLSQLTSDEDRAVLAHKSMTELISDPQSFKHK